MMARTAAAGYNVVENGKAIGLDFVRLSEPGLKMHPKCRVRLDGALPNSVF